MDTNTITSALTAMVQTAVKDSELPPARIARETNIPRTTFERRLKADCGDFTVPQLLRIAHTVGGDFPAWAAELDRIAKEAA